MLNDTTTEVNNENLPPVDEFRRGLVSLLNCHSKENASNTPDFILANFLIDCLEAFDNTVLAREAWYGRLREQESLMTDFVWTEKRSERRRIIQKLTEYKNELSKGGLSSGGYSNKEASVGVAWAISHIAEDWDKDRQEEGFK